MPKTTNTRAQRANELHKMLQRGPSLGIRPDEMLTAEKAEARVRAWLQSWILPEALALISELKGRRMYPMPDEPGHAGEICRDPSYTVRLDHAGGYLVEEPGVGSVCYCFADDNGNEARHIAALLNLTKRK